MPFIGIWSLVKFPQMLRMTWTFMEEYVQLWEAALFLAWSLQSCDWFKRYFSLVFMF